MARSNVGMLVAFVALVSVACGGGHHRSRIAQSNIDGIWSGSASDDVIGDGTVDIDFSQNGSTIGGTWQIFDSADLEDDDGTLAGEVNGNLFDATFTSSNGECALRFIGERDGEDEIAGIYEVVEPCDDPDRNGDFRIFRQ
jgi:hypothetical protein